MQWNLPLARIQIPATFAFIHGMGIPLVYEVIEKPATSGVVIILVGTWFALKQRSLGYAEVGLSYDKAVNQHQVWRVITAQASHIELLHLIFNCSSLWSLRSFEKTGWKRASQHSALQYLRISALLLLLSGVVTLAVYHVLVVYLRRDHFLHVTMVGYSGVVFGLMTLGALSEGGSFNVAGLFSVPALAAPFVSLIITSAIIRRAAFVGHLSGIVSGWAMAAGFFDWLDGWWTLSLLIWGAAIAIWQRIRSGDMRLPFFRAEEVDSLESGVAARFPTISGVDA